MGLRGYGKLIIIKHDNTYLSVRAQRDLLVKKGVREQGPEMQMKPRLGRVGLHFESGAWANRSIRLNICAGWLRDQWLR